MPTLVDETIYFFLGTKQLKTMARQKAKLRRPHSHSLTERWSKAIVSSKAAFNF